jgi:hypothetical protein
MEQSAYIAFLPGALIINQLYQMEHGNKHRPSQTKMKNGVPFEFSA